MSVIEIEIVYGNWSEFDRGYILWIVTLNGRPRDIMELLNCKLQRRHLTVKHIIHNGKQLDIDKTIRESDIRNGDTLFAIM